MPSFSDRLSHAWNAFNGRDQFRNTVEYGTGMAIQNPNQIHKSYVTSKSILGTILNRLAVDAASIDIKHVTVDENEMYQAVVNSSLNNCLTWQANIDQTARHFRQDCYEIMMEYGVVAIVPVDAEAVNDDTGNVLNIKTLRAGRVVEWYPQHVKVNLYNDRIGQAEDIILPKQYVAIAENPFYEIMNMPNATLKRLRRKLALLDIVDEKNGSDKLDLIIQLPYTLKGDIRQQQAETRRKAIETQLAGSQYGIAYIDGTEHITQLNRSVESSLDKQVEYLTTQLYNQLGLTPTVFDGTADEAAMLNYQTNVLEPLVDAVMSAMEVKFISATAKTKGHRLAYFKDPFKLVPVSQIADIADKFTRNEIMTPNEMRSKVGLMPSGDPESNELRNRNISQSKEEIAEKNGEDPEKVEEAEAPEEKEAPKKQSSKKKGSKKEDNQNAKV